MVKGEFLFIVFLKIFFDFSVVLEVSWWKGDIFFKGVGFEVKIFVVDIFACGFIVYVIDGVLFFFDGDGEFFDE